MIPGHHPGDNAWNPSMARDFLAEHLRDKPYLWVMHDPVNEKGQHQPHMHVLFSERSNDGIDRGPAHHFRRSNATHPERGGAQKDAWFKQRSTVYEIRTAWCDWTNYTMERAGHEGRIHPSSLYKRGIDRQPEPKVGPSKDPALITERERIRQQRDEAKEQAQAAEAWEARKLKIGLTDVHQITPSQFVHDTRQRARNVQPGQWVPGMPSAQAQQQTRRMQQHDRLARAVHRLETELRILERRQTIIHLPRGRGQERERIGNGLRANLREEEQEQEREHGW